MPAERRAAQSEPGSRVLLVGPPNSFKTTSIIQTWPRSPKHPLVHLSLPGEKGWETVPTDDPSIIPLVWRIDDPATVSAAQIVREVETETYQALAGKYGALMTLALEGFHKYFEWVLQAAMDDLLSAAENKGKEVTEEDVRWPAYGRAYDRVGQYLTRISHHPVPYVVVSVWEDMVKDNPDDTSRKASKHKYPDLPQKLAKRIVGEFAAVLYCGVAKRPTPEGKGADYLGWWLTRASSEVWGVGLKGLPPVVKNIPAKIPADFRVLQRYLKGDLPNLPKPVTKETPA